MFYFYIFYFLLIFEVLSANIESTINDYFNSETFNSFQKEWQKHKKSYENAIQLALKDNYGYKGMNVYIRKSADAHRIANGFYLSDGVVGLMFQDMFLGELPHVFVPEVTFALASNVLCIESNIDKIIIDTRYRLFRNQSDVVYGNPDNKNSPFTYDVVENIGNLAVIADDCKLRGYAITKLSRQSVDIGHDTFQVSDCKFSVEITSPGSGREPVTAEYFDQKQSRALEKLISKPIREELLPKLQGSLLTYINTTLIFQDRLSEYRQQQHKIFKKSSKYINKLIRNVNKNSLQLNQAATTLKPFHITWNACADKSCVIHVDIKQVTVYGLDSVFSAHRGGPFKLQSHKIGETIAFNYVQVRGKIGFENETIKSTHNFFAEIDDVTFNIELGIDNQVQDYCFLDWRSIELSIMNFKGNIEERINAHSFIIGYLYNEIPKELTEYLHKVIEGKNNNDKFSYMSDREFYNNGISSSSGETYGDHGENKESKLDNSEKMSKGVEKYKKFDQKGEIKKNSILLSLHSQNNNGQVITLGSSESSNDETSQKHSKGSSGYSGSENNNETEAGSQERKKKH